MVDDSGLYCDSYHTTELGDTDHTVIYVMGKSRFPQWLKGRKNEIETISENFMIFPSFYPTLVKYPLKAGKPCFFVCREAQLFTQVQTYMGNYRKEG